tara:strand:+ start:1164 stop:1313 length:150 start_codon:yes stop_codon:yes gene_type:complete
VGIHPKAPFGCHGGQLGHPLLELVGYLKVVDAPTGVTNQVVVVTGEGLV